MSKAIEVLMHEHRIIERVLEALKNCAAAARQGGPVDRAAISDFAEFFKNFADKCHHGKEEEQLFAAMIQHGFPKDQGPIAVMLTEHARGRESVSALAAIGKGTGPLTEAERKLLADQAEAYYTLLRSHIEREDNVLYPMAVRMLPGTVLARMEHDFETFEKESMGEGAHERYHELAHKLMAAFPAD